MPKTTIMLKADMNQRAASKMTAAQAVKIAKAVKKVPEIAAQIAKITGKKSTVVAADVRVTERWEAWRGAAIRKLMANDGMSYEDAVKWSRRNAKRDAKWA